MSEHQEVERKFLVDEQDFQKLDKRDWKHQKIKQVYLAVTKDREVRLRETDRSEVIMAIKSSGDMMREEVEIMLTSDQAQKLSSFFNEQALSKTRYTFPLQNYMVEVDVYHEDLTGLIVAEVEFGSESEANNFNPPDWMHPEVTEFAQNKNKNLSGKTYGELKRSAQ